MAPPVQDAPAVLRIDPTTGAVTLSIVGADGLEVDYLVEAAPPGFGSWAVTLRRLDQKDGPYRVERSASGRWSCDCKWSKYVARKAGMRCKHLCSLRLVHAFVVRLATGGGA